MYSPIDKAKAVWLCVTLIVLFILVVCIVLPIAITQPQTVQDTCLSDDECLDQCIRKMKTIENLETDLSNPNLISVSTAEKSKGLSSISLTTTVSPRTDPQLTDPPATSPTTPSNKCDETVCSRSCTLGCTDPPPTSPPVTCSPTACLDVKKIWMNLKIFNVVWIC